MRFLSSSSNTALVLKDEKVSFDQLLRASEGIARNLSLEAGERVVIFSENRLEWAYAFYAIWRCKGIAVPVDAMSTVDDMVHVLRDADPAGVFYSAGTWEVLKEALEKTGSEVRLMSLEDCPEPSPEVVEFPEAEMERTAVIIYTSGTTGSPKGVMLNFRNLHSNIKSISSDVPIYRPDSRVLALLPLHHILPLQGALVGPLLLGGTTVFCPSIASEDIIQTLQDNKVTLLLGVPRLFTAMRNGIRTKIDRSLVARLLFALAEKVDSLAFSRLLFRSVQKKFGGAIAFFPCGGAPLDTSVWRDFRTLGFELLNGYGMSEAAPIISFTRPGNPRAGSVGQLMPENEVKIENGEILVKGANVTSGYFRRPEETAELLKDGWLHTGDLGHLDEDGFLFITGRCKELIVLPNGKNVQPSEVEEKLAALSPALGEVAVLLVKGNLHALIVPDMAALKELGVHQIEEYLRQDVLDAYNRKAIPYKRIHKLTISKDPLPKTRLGKLRRHELSALLERTQTRGTEPVVEPDTEEYGVIRDFLTQQSGEEVRPDDHFEIDLAMDSLDKVALLAFLQQTFGVSFDESTLIENSTPAKIAEQVGKQRTRLSVEKVNWAQILKEKVNISLPKSGLPHVWINRFARICLRTLFKVRSNGTENLPDGPCILAPNHQSFLDGLFVSIFLRKNVLKRTYFYAKSSHVRHWWTRFLASTNNVIVIDINRNIKESLQKLAEALRQGGNVIIFPEGTRSRDGSLGGFKKTFAILAQELGVPIVPVAIQGAHEILPPGHKFPRLFRPVEISFLNPVQPGTGTYGQLAERVLEAVSQKISKSDKE